MATASLPIKLPASLKAERRGAVAILRLTRANKRNAIDDTTIVGIETFFSSLPEDIRAVLLAGEGEHFCAGLDLSELKERGISEGIAHSGMWHRAFDRLQFGKAPVVAVLHGAVVGGAAAVEPVDARGNRARASLRDLIQVAYAATRKRRITWSPRGDDSPLSGEI